MLANFLLVVSKRGLAIISTLFSCSRAESSKSNNLELIEATCKVAEAPATTGKFTFKFCTRPPFLATSSILLSAENIPQRTPSSCKFLLLMVTMRASMAICSVGLSSSLIKANVFLMEAVFSLIIKLLLRSSK